MEKIDNVFLQHCSDVLANTNSPLSSAMIVKLMNTYAIDYGISIPDTLTVQQSPNKRTLLFGYLRCFSLQQQYEILNRLIESQIFDTYEDKYEIDELKMKLQERFITNDRYTVQKREVKKIASAESLLTKKRAHSEKQSFDKDITANVNRKIFISHCSKDAGIIGTFKTYILIAGLGLTDSDIVCTSFDETGIGAGGNIPQYIHDNIAMAAVVLCMVSQSYKQSEVCQNEVGAAWALQKKIIQIVLPDNTQDSVGWLLNLDKAIKINKPSSLDNLQVRLCEDLHIQVKSPLLWNPHKEDFLKALANLPKCAENDLMQSMIVDNRKANELQYDKKRFEYIDSHWTETEFVSIVEDIVKNQKYDEYQADFLDEMVYYNKYVKDHFVNEVLQEYYTKMCDSISQLICFLSTYFSPSYGQWCSESIDGKSQEEIDDIKRRRVYVWHENYDLPKKLYEQRYEDICTELPKLGKDAISAYGEFRKQIKAKLLV